ncbi:MAG: helix-turn-helix domain-containing protein [Chloroflexota bacterium]|nr:helix-turn-helix domain-containing protein [Chloroflexota bacterium]
MSASPAAGADDGRGLPRKPPPNKSRFTINELIELSGFSLRTIRYYIQEGLLRAANGRGPTATYDRDHMLRLLRLAEIRDEIPSIAAKREYMANLTTSDLEAHFTVRSGPREEHWRRILVHPNLELQVRVTGEERDYRFEKALDQIVQHARIVLEAYEAERG